MTAKTQRAFLVGVLSLGAAPGPARANVIRFRIDPAHSALTFKATSRVVNADGRSQRFAGDVSVDQRDPTTARIAITAERTLDRRAHAP